MKPEDIKIRKGFQQLLDEANAVVRTITPEDAIHAHKHYDVEFIDLREAQELQRDGMIPGAFNAPRGMLEFWVDPTSPYYKPVFSVEKAFILYCASGWRSALATKTLKDMGFPNVMHIAGGFSGWQGAAGKIQYHSL